MNHSQIAAGVGLGAVGALAYLPYEAKKAGEVATATAAAPLNCPPCLCGSTGKAGVSTTIQTVTKSTSAGPIIR